MIGVSKLRITLCRLKDLQTTLCYAEQSDAVKRMKKLVSEVTERNTMIKAIGPFSVPLLVKSKSEILTELRHCRNLIGTFV